MSDRDRKRAFLIIHVCFPRVQAIKRDVSTKGISLMLRLALAVIISAPLLSGCIVISSEKPTTRVIQTPPADAQ